MHTVGFVQLFAQFAYSFPPGSNATIDLTRDAH
jgi:hypothetical protein